MKLTVYTKTVCPQCAPIKTYMKSNNLKHELINVDNEPEALDYVRNLGYQSLPVLVLEEDGDIVETSAGKDAALKIMEWNKKEILDKE